MPTYDLGDGLHVEMRPREKGHKIPNAHAWLGNRKNDVSISFDGRKIVGGLKGNKKEEEKRATAWIMDHAKELKKFWGRD